MPETIRSGFEPKRPRSAKRTQSTGVPSVAKPLSPSSNLISSTQSGDRVVIDRAVAERFASGAMTWTSTPSRRRSSLRIACSPSAPIPSSLVRRTFTGFGAILGAGVALTLCAAGPIPGAAAAGKPLGEGWVGTGAIESVRPNGLTEVGLERTPDDVLHLAYPVFGVTEAGSELETIDHEILVGTNPDKMATKPANYTPDLIAQALPAQNQGLNPSVELISTPTGLRVFFAGLF